MKGEAESYDANREAHEEGISLPVSIDGPLMETLTPSPFLKSLGITREQRITNLLRIVKAMLHPKDESIKQEETNTIVPFMVLQGPLVREECLTVTVDIKRDAGGKKAITISRISEINE